MMAKYKYQPSKTLVKVGIVAGEVIVAGFLAYITDKPQFLVVAPILEGVLDYLKHRK